MARRGTSCLRAALAVLVAAPLALAVSVAPAQSASSDVTTVVVTANGARNAAAQTWAGSTWSMVLERRDQVTDAQQTPPSPRDSPGAKTLVLALLIGLLALVAVLLGVAALSPQGADVRRAARELVRVRAMAWRERRLPDDERRIPTSERRRRTTDGWRDLSAALGGGQPARAVAEVAAHDEELVRSATAERAAAQAARAEAQARATQRRMRMGRQAELFAAQERARRETAYRNGVDAKPIPGELTDTERAALAAVVEVNWILAAQQAAAEEATERRMAAELAAEEAARRARVEEEAAAAAREARSAAERAAEEARSAAERAAEEARRLAVGAGAGRAAPVEDSRRTVRSRVTMHKAAAASAGPRVIDLRAPSEEAFEPVAAASTTDVRPGDKTAARSPEPTRPDARVASRAPASRVTTVDLRAADLAAAPAEVALALPETASLPAAPARAARNAAVRSDAPSGSLLALWAGLVVLPMLCLLRTAGQGAWWTELTTGGLALLGLAALLGLVGVTWLWAAVRAPHVFGRLPRKWARQPQATQGDDVAAAARLLDRLGSGTPVDDAWHDFEASIGTPVPASTRSVVLPGTDPGAVVRYLSGDRRGDRRLSLLVCAPFVVCLLPAAVLLLLA